MDDVGLGLGLHLVQAHVLGRGQGQGLAEDQVVALGLLHLHGTAVAGGAHAVGADHRPEADLGDLGHHGGLLLVGERGLLEPGLDDVGLGRIGADPRDPACGAGLLVGLADGDPAGVVGVVLVGGRVALGGLLGGATGQAVGLAAGLAHDLHGVRVVLLGLDGEEGLLLGGQAVVEGLLVGGQLGEGDEGGRGHGGLLGGGGLGGDGGVGLAGHGGLLRLAAAVVLS